MAFGQGVYGNQQGYLNPYVTTGQNANATIAALLGNGGTPQQQAAAKNAYGNYLNSTGYQFQLGQGQKAINTNQAASGLLNSGATGKALTQYGQGLASNYFNNYLNSLSGLSGQGLTAAESIGNTGAGVMGGEVNAANNTGQAANNLFSGIGSFLGGIF